MPQSGAPLRVLVAGAGLFGREHIERLAARADTRIVGVADSSPAALERLRAANAALPTWIDALRMIEETDADAIVVATPAASHAEIATCGLRRGLCVLLEKPVAPTVGAAADLLEVERRSSGFVLPGHVLRFSSDHRRLVDVVRSGRIGKIVYVNSRRYRDDSHAARYPDDDPVLMTLVHDIDLAQWIAGEAFGAVLARRSAGAGFRSLTATSATSASGVICELRTAWTFTDGRLPVDRLEAVGERGSVELFASETLHVYAEGRREERGADEADDPLRNEHDHFLACVRDRSLRPALGLAEAIAGLKYAEAAVASLRKREEIAVAP